MVTIKSQKSLILTLARVIVFRDNENFMPCEIYHYQSIPDRQTYFQVLMLFKYFTNKT